MGKPLRVFIALILPEEIVDCLVRIQRSMQSKGLHIGWVRPENLHLTIKFFGDIPETDVLPISEALQKTAQAMNAFELSVETLGVFPGIKKPRVLWSGLGGSTHALRQLYGRLEQHLEFIGFKPEKRSFKAHLTLGRIRKPLDPKWLLAVITDCGRFAPRPFIARRLALYKSDLQPAGAVYTPLCEVALTD